MRHKKQLFVSWLIGAGLMVGVFYVAVAWLWSAVARSRAASLETQTVSALSNDLAEGNLFKLGNTLSKLKRDGLLRFAEIRQVGRNKSALVFRTQEMNGQTDVIFNDFRCGEQRKLITRSETGVSLITTLPGNIIGTECAALFITSDLPPELKQFKYRILMSFGILLAAVFGLFFWVTLAWYRRILDLETANKTIQIEKEATIGRMAAQVAHDIRSPLTALDAALKNAAQMPEEQRIIVRYAVNRIRDIANNLLEKNRQQAKSAAGAVTAAEEPAEVCLISSIVDPVVTEKRLQFESKPGINIDFKLTGESYGLFARIQPVEFKRLVSNLVNNAVEVLGDKGTVNVGLDHKDKNIILTVADNGKGIPPEILAKLGQRGETHGKAGGSGLGLFHARTTAERWGGSLIIASELGKGTTVTINLPAAGAPSWFVSTLKLPAGKAVVVLDDDETIHQVWRGRFESARVKEQGIEVYHFSEPAKLRGWVKDNPAKAENAVYLFDFELLGHTETGLIMAQELNIAPKVILVTSRYEEKRITDECKRLAIRMIPKGLAGLVPITAGDRIAGGGKSEETASKPVIPAQAATPAVTTPATAGGLVAVLLDDDALVHMTWKMTARNNGVTLKAFKTPAEFFANLGNLSKDTPIYIDSELGDGVKGEDIAKDLREKGFAGIYLETGHPPEKFSHLPWLKVIGKEPPWGEKDED